MSLNCIPNEILPLITSNLSLRDIGSWVLTQKRHSKFLAHELYKQAAKRDETTLKWPACLALAAVSSNVVAFKLLLKTTNLELINNGVIRFDSIPALKRWRDRWYKKVINFNTLKIMKALGSDGGLIHLLCKLDAEEMVGALIAKANNDHEGDGNDVLLNLSGFDPGNWNPLLISSHMGHLGIVKQLLETGVVMDTYATEMDSLEYRSPLGLAILNKHVRVAELILDFDADRLIYGPCIDLVCVAAVFDNIAIIKRILAANVGYPQDSFSECLGSFLCAHGNNVTIPNNGLEITQLFLDAGSIPTADAMCAAAEYYGMEMMQLLIKHGGDIRARKEDDGFTVLHAAQCPQVARMLIDEAPELLNAETHDGTTPLDISYMKKAGKDRELASMFIEAGGQLKAQIAIDNSAGTTPLHSAVLSEHEDIVQKLLAMDSLKPLLNIRSQVHLETPLHLACHIRNIPVARRMVRYLIDAGMELYTPDFRGDTALQTAVKNRSPDAKLLVHDLMEAGFDVNALTSNGGTSLHTAISAKNHHIIDTLIEAGVDLDVKAQRGSTVLHYLGYLGDHVDSALAADKIIKAGANITLKNKRGLTPLHVAAQAARIIHLPVRGYVDMASAVLQGNLDVTVEDVGGSSKLYSLYRTGFMELMRVLVSAGADAFIQDKKGRTALDYIVADYSRDE